MRQYEVTFIVDPVLSGDEIKAAVKTYNDLLTDEGCEIVNIDNLGLKQLAYPINKRNSGVYNTIEFKTENGLIIQKLELSLRRDERIMRFLSVYLDKYAIKFNEDRRAGKIGKKESIIKNGANAKPKDDVKATDKGSSNGKSSGSKDKTPVTKTPTTTTPATTTTSGNVTETRTFKETRTVKEPVVVSETAAVTTAAATTVAATPVEATPDDLTKIEGIGPKTLELLNENGITSFRDLASSSQARLQELLSNAGGAFATMNPSTWTQQSQLAVDGQWDELKSLQDKLDGGIAKSEEE